jgi:PAS domain S-box-containing protein
MMHVIEHGQSANRSGVSESRFRRMADAAPAMLWMAGPDRGWTYLNRCLLEFTGRSLDSELGNGWTENVHSDDLQRCLATYSHAFEARQPFSTEYRLRRHDGEYRWIASRGSPCFTSDRRFEGYVGTCLDINDRKEGEERIRRSEAKFRLVFDSNVVPLLCWHEDGRVLEANDAYLALFGASRDEVEAGALRWSEHAPAEDLRLDRASLAAVLSGKLDAAAYEREYVRRDGGCFTARVAGCLLPGRSDQGIAFAVDLSERKRAAAALRNNERLVRSVFASLYGYVAVIDCAGTIVAVNDAWRQLDHAPGWDAKAPMVGVNYLELCERAAARGDQASAAAAAAIREVLSRRAQPNTIEYRNRVRDQECWFEMIVLPLQRAEGGAVVSHLDITPRHRAEVEAERLRNDLSHVTRVSIMGELTASLAHELNQPLMAILSNTQAALRMLGDGREVPPELREILEDIAFDDQRAGEIITKLRQLMKKGQFQLQAVDLNKAVIDVSALLESDALIREMTIERELTADLPPVLGDYIQLQQVLLNLMMNGLEAMRTVPKGSDRKLVVRTRTDGQTVSVAVTDAGTGIRREGAGMLFEPFFTTKPEGMGMGLAISQSILTALGGRITGRNNADRGATFEFEVPVMRGNQP